MRVLWGTPVSPKLDLVMISTLAFLVSILCALYIVAGYPLLLKIWARFCAKPVVKGNQLKSVSIVIPAYNGGLFVAEKLDSILRLDYPPDLIEILVVSDGSTDQTVSEVEKYFPRGVRLLEIPRSGKCAALNEGIARARNEILLLTDVRQTLAPDSLRALMTNFADPSVGVVSGDLKIRRGRYQEEVATGLYWKYENWMRTQLSRIDSIFGATGPFYAMRRELAIPIPVDMLLDDMYLPLAAFFRRYRLILESEAHALDYPTSLHTEFKRKVRTLGGNYQILLAYPALLGRQNRMLFHFLSYKFARLLLPWVFLLLFLSSCFLTQPWRWIALGCQVALYLLAVLDPLMPETLAIKRITSPARTFVAMMLAALCGLSVFLFPPRSLWKETKIESSQL
jgi:cellulose synthase/poly-beta-1,6-N-acetylglucosamine synthase-like glycosyltransferase